MDQSQKIIRCERCGEILQPERVVYLDLSISDGKYYFTIPEDHDSQGGFAFGSTCARKQIEEQNG